MNRFLLIFIAILLLACEAWAIWLDSAPDSAHIGVGVDEIGLFSVGVPPSPRYPYVRSLLRGNYRHPSPDGAHINVLIDSVVYTTNMMLVFEHPDSAVYLGGHSFTPTTLDPLNNWIITEWMITGGPHGHSGIKISQILQPQESGGSGTVAMKWVIQNFTPSAHRIGLMVFFDTKINQNDSAKIVCPGVPWSDSLRILPNPHMGWALPPFWAAYESEDPLDTTALIAKGVLTVPPNTPPDRVAFGDARDFLATLWDPLGAIPRYNDSAVLTWWYPEPIAAGGTKVIQTSYGLSEDAAAISGIYGLSITYPKNLLVANCRLLPNPFGLSISVTNNDTIDSDITVALDFSSAPNCTLVPGETWYKNTVPRTLSTHQTGFVFWNIQVKEPKPLTDTINHFTVLAFTADHENRSPAMPVNIKGTDYIGPVVRSSEPLFGTITSNPRQPIKIYIRDSDSRVDTMRIFFAFITATGETIYVRISDPRLSFRNDTLYYIPHIDLINGAYYWYRLVQADDIHGCPSEPDSGRFLVDLTGPILYDHFPPTGSIQNDSLVMNWVTARDALGRLREASATFRIWYDGLTSIPVTVRGGVPGDGVSIRRSTEVIPPDTVRWMPSAWTTGLGHIPDGYVTIALAGLTDDPDYGTPNPAEGLPRSWDYIMNSHGPRVRPICPMPANYVSVPDTDIVFYLYDGNSIIPDSTRIMLDGAVLPWVSGRRDSIHRVIITPSAGFPDGYIVNFEVLRAFDSLGTPLDRSTTTSWFYRIDTSRPYIYSTYPLSGDTLGTDACTIRVVLRDAYSGIDPSTLTITINGTPAFTTYNPVTGEAIVPATGLGTTVAVRVRVCDRIDVGPDNCLDTTFTFYTSLAGPRATLFGRSTGIICGPTDQIRWSITDPDGIATATITVVVNGITYNLTSPALTYNVATGVLTFTPTSPWVDGTSVSASLTAVEDIFGHGLASPVGGSWIVDIDGAVWSYDVAESLDALTGYFYDTLIHIIWRWGDGIIDSVSMTANGIVFSAGSPGFTITDTAILFNSVAAGFRIEGGITYRFIIRAKTVCAFSPGAWYLDTLTIYATNIEEDETKLPRGFALYPNRPDPFNAATIVPFSLATDGDVRLEIRDILGRNIRTLVDSRLNKGYHEAVWDGSDTHGRQVPGGIYFCRLITAKGSATERITLIK